MSAATRLALCYLTAVVLLAAGAGWFSPGAGLLVAGAAVAAAGTALYVDWTPKDGET